MDHELEIRVSSETDRPEAVRTSLVDEVREKRDLYEANPLFADEGLSITWRELKFTVKDRHSAGPCCGLFDGEKAPTKIILNSINGHVHAGKLLAIMGPSGCGKTSFLDIIGGVGGSSSGKLSGQLMVNGKALEHRELKRDLAHVQQDDSLNGNLSVYENIWYAAQFLLPHTMTYKEKNARVKEVIEELGLNKCKHTKIGTWLYRGVSGGERRRCSIALALLNKPKILLLDEPTSGLDSLSASNLLETLRSLCATGKTIITTIHQPSSQVFYQFDGLFLLSEGRQMFFGTPSDAIEFFSQFNMPNHVNPADFFLEKINVSYELDNESKTMRLDEVANAWAKSPAKEKLDKAIESYAGEYAGKAAYKDQIKDSIRRMITREQYNSTFLGQLFFLSHRFFLHWIRDIGVFWARVVMYTLLAIMMGTEYLRQNYTQKTIQDRISILFFSCAFLVFMSVSAVPFVIEDRVIFKRERANGYYSVLPYTLASTLTSIPFIFLISLLFTVTCYFLMNMHMTAEAFFFFLLDLWFALMVAEGIVMTISSLVPAFILGIAVGAGLFGAFMVNQGYFLRADNIPWWWKWLHYCTVHKYSFEGFMVNEFENVNFSCQFDNVTPITYYDLYNETNNLPYVNNSCYCFYRDLLGTPCVIEGFEILAEYGYQYINKWAWLGIMLSMVVIFRFFFYLALKFANRP